MVVGLLKMGCGCANLFHMNFCLSSKIGASSMGVRPTGLLWSLDLLLQLVWSGCGCKQGCGMVSWIHRCRESGI
jgi:hypothetical protein